MYYNLQLTRLNIDISTSQITQHYTDAKGGKPTSYSQIISSSKTYHSIDLRMTEFF